MKKLLVMLSILFAFEAVEAQKILWITFVDTTDPRVGAIDINGHKVLYDNFVNEVNSALAEKGYMSDVQDFTGDKVSPENCKSAVELLNVEPEDIVVFYYIGHGGRPNTTSGYIEQHPFPQLCLAQHDERKFIPLEWVHNVLKEKGARLSVTIGMACNSLANDITEKSGPTFSVNYGMSYMSSNKMSRIQELFLSYKGNVIATSAMPTQASIGCETVFGPMDLYSAAVCDVFKNVLDGYTSTFSWTTFLDIVGKTVEESTQYKQSPFYIANVEKSSMPSVSTPSETPTSTPTSAGEIDKNELTNALTKLASVSTGIDARFNMKQELEHIFASGAIVKMLSHDGSVVIDKMDASDFLGRVATSRLLLSVSVVDVVLTGGKIKSLKVKETYCRK